MTLDAHHLSCLLAIARTGSFSRAAAELGQSQPTLSNNIALLERRLGVRVLDRSKRGSTLTAHGAILVRRAEGLQAMLDDAEKEVRNLDLAISGPLRIGATPSVLPALLPKTLATLRAEWSASMIEIVEDLDQSLGPQLRTGKIDMIVGPVHEQFTETPDIVETELLIDPFCIAVGPDSRFRDRESVLLAELAGETWVLPRDGSTYRRHVEAMFLTAGVNWPANAIYANSLYLLESMVSLGNCVTFVSPVQLRLPVTGFKVLRVENGSHRKIGFKMRKAGRLSPLGTRFLDALTGAAAQMADDFRSLQLAAA
jgi:DNA-binding transcriptional LysR family regulator